MPVAQGASVLVVEDDYVICMELEMVLSELGFETVLCVPSAKEAFDLLEGAAFDLVTVDIRLADGDCVSFAEWLRDRGQTFIYITGFADCRGMPTAPLVKKPVMTDDLDCAVRQACPWR